MTKLLRAEPVLLGAALTATVHGLCLLAGLDTAPTAVVDGIALGWIAWMVRVLSVPAAKAQAAVADAHDAGRAAGLADVASLHVFAAPPAPAKHAPRKAAAK